MITVVPYEPDHWPGIEAAHDAARMQELQLAGLEAAFLPLSVAAEREGLFDYSVYVAKLGEEVAGFVAFAEEELAWLYVNPVCQKRGVGSALAEYALLRMGQGEKMVEVLLGNEPARKLYRRLGFTAEQLLHGHMPGNEEFAVSAWQMIKK